MREREKERGGGAYSFPIDFAATVGSVNQFLSVPLASWPPDRSMGATVARFQSKHVEDSVTQAFFTFSITSNSNSNSSSSSRWTNNKLEKPERSRRRRRRRRRRSGGMEYVYIGKMKWASESIDCWRPDIPRMSVD